MTIRKKLVAGLLLFVALLTIASFTTRNLAQSSGKPPNVVLIFADDLGYADIGSFASQPMGYKTPNLDRMAQEGIRLTNFYVTQAVCSASRAALLTGCYSNRVGIQGALDHRAKYGINAAETTLAEIFKSAKTAKSESYATAIYGKWHLGHLPEFLPTRHGFDEYFGLPYSNDMWPNHPINKNYYPDLPLIENEKVVKLMPDQTQLSTTTPNNVTNQTPSNNGSYEIMILNTNQNKYKKGSQSCRIQVLSM